MDLDAIIYIIILIGSLIIGVIGKSKKKPIEQKTSPVIDPNDQKPKSPEYQVKKNEDSYTGSTLFKDLLEKAQEELEFSDLEIQEEPDTQNVNNENISDDKEILDSPESDLDKPSDEEGISTTQLSEIEFLTKKEDFIKKINFLKEFDPKSAIIYSEIINRKYF